MIQGGGRQRTRRRVGPLAGLALVVSSLVSIGIGVAPAYAAPGIEVAKSASGTVLVDGVATFTLTATNPPANPDAANEFNVSFRDELAPGVTYVPGSTTPADVGDPRISTDPGDGHQILVWPDVADMRPDAEVRLSFQAHVDPTDYPVGASFTNSGNAYASTDPTEVPEFDGAGNATGGFTEQATSSTTTTQVGAIDVTKSSTITPEGELLRGIHQHPSTYTLRVTNNPEAATDGALLVDYLPAGLEFLGCGDVDNTPGARSSTPAPVGWTRSPTWRAARPRSASTPSSTRPRSTTRPASYSSAPPGRPITRLGRVATTSRDPVLEPIGPGRRSLVEVAADRIRLEVLAGGYRQGHHLVEARIAEELQISRGPVREALKMLRAEGLVTEEPRRGRFVVTITADDVRDVYELRAAIEGAAARALCRRGEAADVERLDAAVDAMAAASARSDAIEVARADVAFHALLCELSGNGRLVETFQRYVPVLRGLLRMDEQALGSVESVADQHRPIVDAIRVRNEAGAVRLVVEHAEHAGELLANLLDGRE